jgi:hypothetical protein
MSFWCWTKDPFSTSGQIECVKECEAQLQNGSDICELKDIWKNSSILEFAEFKGGCLRRNQIGDLSLLVVS